MLAVLSALTAIWFSVGLEQQRWIATTVVFIILAIVLGLAGSDS